MFAYDLILNPHPERLVGFNACIVIVKKLPVKGKQKHNIFQAVNLVNKLADAFIGIFPAQLGVVDHRQAGTV